MLSQMQIFTQPDSSELVTRADLVRFVRQHPKESHYLEYKPLRELRGCGKCEYCNGRGNPRQSFGVNIARAVASIANGSGGTICVGVVRKGSNPEKHAVETSACPGFTYSADQITQTINERVVPAVFHRIQEVQRQGRNPPAFLIDIPASMSLHAWKDECGRLRYCVRRAATTAELTPVEIEFQVRTKSTLALNAEFRSEVFYLVVSLFADVLERPNDYPHLEWTPEKILQEDPCSVSRNHPLLSRWPIDEKHRKLVYEMPAKTAAHNAPRHIRHTVERLTWAEKHLTQNSLDRTEVRLLAAARQLEEDQNLMDELSPLAYLSYTTDKSVWQRVSSEFGSSRYEETFEQVFNRVAKAHGLQLWDEREKRRAVYQMANVLALLLPLSYQVLEFYEALVREYGGSALAIEPKTFKARRVPKR
jgi:hypothetical protein